MSKKPLWLLLVVFALLFTITPLAAQQANPTTVYATAQRFEHGLMIWRSDTAHIWVLADNGQALNYPNSSYVNLPDNPIFGTPPSRLRPIFGFGKVWGNVATVRNLLGWPTLPEIGFNMPLSYEHSVYFLTQLDRSTIVIYANNTWARVNPQPAQARPIEATMTTTYAAFQQYEHGFMIWRGDTGTVYAFYGSTGGLTGGWGQRDYEGLPDNTITNPPAGLITPVSGFGRVWGNNQAVRNTLGWATGTEQGYTLTITSYPEPPVYFDPAAFTLPDGRTVAFASYGRYWSVQ